MSNQENGFDKHTKNLTSAQLNNHIEEVRKINFLFLKFFRIVNGVKLNKKITRTI